MGLLSALGSLAGNIIAPGFGSVIGGALGGALESGAGSSAQGKATQQANANAAAASQFRPVGITNTFGTSNFAYDPKTGQMTSAGYTLSPQLQALQSGVMGGLGTQDTQRLQGLGRGYLAQTPQQAAEQWMASQRELLTPSRDLQRSQIQQSLFNTGRGGLSVAQGGQLGAANPEMQAYYNALAQQDLELASKAQQMGQQQTAFGAGLLSNAYQPLTAGLSAAGAIEGLGQQPLELSSALAGRSATAGGNAAKYLSAMDYSPSGSFWTGMATSPYNTAINQAAGEWGTTLGNQYNMLGNNAAMATTPNYLNAAGQLPSLDYSNFNW